MSEDPYNTVQEEVQTSLQAASTLRSSYLRIRSTAREPDSEELVWARNELKATLAALEADLEDLEESVKIVESTGARMFGLEEQEVIERRRYVEFVRKEIDNMRVELESEPGIRSRPTSRLGMPSPRIGPSATATGVTGDDQSEWAKQEQQVKLISVPIRYAADTPYAAKMMIRQQDETIDTIAGTLTTLAEQAGLMGQEISEHNEMLTDLERNVDGTDSKLGNAMRKMKWFIRQTEERKSGWCIAILIVILMALLLAVILV
ncbi:t-SNARE [Irpex rosettiformis]|uniref:t-SNARE n=1 Tax=Irpex rosettiformis TaxID=378272 RepID=A0ACB8U852_9APHY|nr:t-SNARE [Irpex rosettiformis]